MFLDKKYLIDNKELMKEWNWEKNKQLKPQNITSGSHEKMWWKCKNGHEWEAVVHTRMKGAGCPYCAGKMAIKGLNDLKTLYPNLLNEWDYKKNDELGIKPNEISAGSKKKVNWICDKGHKYIKSIYDKTHGSSNCPYCSNKKILKGYNDIATTNPELLVEWNYNKNKISPYEVGKNSEKKVWWKCQKCNYEWESSIRNRCVIKSGCPVCANKVIVKRS